MDRNSLCQFWKLSYQNYASATLSTMVFMGWWCWSASSFIRRVLPAR